MGVLSVYHMDIEKFITAKSYEEKKLDHFNLSVMVDDDFMNAVQNDDEVFLHHPVYNKIGEIIKDPLLWKNSKKVRARDIWDKIMQRAYENGEPGVLYYDNMNKDNNTWYVEKIIATNPCAEYLGGNVCGTNPIDGEELNPADYGGACNLGSIMLHRFVLEPFTKDARLNIQNIRRVVRVAINFLDNIIDINTFPDKVYENYQKNFRTIGLGVTGLADMLAMLNMKYDDQGTVAFVDSLMNEIAKEAYRASIDLAVHKGSFPFFDKDKFLQSGFIQKHISVDPEWAQIAEDIKNYGIRNARMISVAPTGTLSLTYGNNCSSGIEPIFQLSFTRSVHMGGQSEDNVKTVKLDDYAYSLWTELGSPKTDVFMTALNISVEDHIKMLGAIAKHTDMSVSKTINVPTDYSFEQVKDIYTLAWEMGIKGCTIFRPNEIRKGVLISDTKKDDVNDTTELKRGYILECNDDLILKKRKLVTGCGSMHVIAGFDPDTGELRETFFNKGSTGGCNNFMVGLSRTISLLGRAGVDITAIVDQLNSTGVCASYATRKAVKHDTSVGSCCPMAIGNVLLDMYNEVQENITIQEPEQSTEHETENCQECMSYAEATSITSRCPECGAQLDYEGGCVQCRACGYSKCG